MRVTAPAKINLYLWVGQRRDDGLHEIESVMQSVSLADELSVSSSDVISLDVEPAGAAPEDESNLVVKAVNALRGTTEASTGTALRLSKQIPAGAGLGGGSSDAAAALIGLNALWNCGLSRKALEKIGASVGADVPFCVRGGTAGALGAGERLAPLVVAGPLWWVIAMPGASLSTAEVYARFDEMGASSKPNDAHDLADALARGDAERIGATLRNDLTDAALALAPGTASVRDALRGAGALGVTMSGSGPAWCGLARDASHAEEIATTVRAEIEQVWIVQSLDRGARIIER